MSADGKWQIVVQSPVGTQRLLASFTEDAGRLTGTVVNNEQGLTTDIFDGSVSGNNAQWKVKLRHISMTLTFDTTIDGDALSGKVKAGLLGSFAVSGTRAS